jgi:hypothetical protein
VGEAGEDDAAVVDFVLKIKFAACLLRALDRALAYVKSRHPLPTPISGIITLAGNSPQNPDVKELTY